MVNHTSGKQRDDVRVEPWPRAQGEADRFDFEVAKRSGPHQFLGSQLHRVFLHACRPLGSIWGQRFSDTFGILIYHRTAPRDASQQVPPYNVTPENFRRQLTGLLDRGYEAWPLRKALQYSQANQPIPRKAFVITFDDGYANNYTHAFPILRELSLPATIFVSTAYLNTNRPFPFDRWPGVGSARESRAWAPLTTDQCETLLDSGLIALGAHTHTHQDFRGRPAEFQADLETSIQVLKTKFGITEPTFAFPQGRKAPGFAGPDLVQAARATEVCCALTSESDLVRKHSDPIGEWGRFTVENSDTPGTLAARLDGWYEGVRQVYRDLRRR